MKTSTVTIAYNLNDNGTESGTTLVKTSSELLDWEDIALQFKKFVKLLDLDDSILDVEIKYRDGTKVSANSILYKRKESWPISDSTFEEEG